MVRLLLHVAMALLLVGCATSRRQTTPDIGSWDTCVFERMSMHSYEQAHGEVCRMAEAFLATLRRIKKEPESLDRATLYWERLAELHRLSPSEFASEVDWADFKACSAVPGAEVLSYSAKRGNYSEHGMVVVKDGKVLKKHKVEWGTQD